MTKIFTLIASLAFMALLLTLATGEPMQETDRVLEENEIEECESDEEFLECGSECPEACYNLGQARACGLRCKSGCFCTGGLVRNPDGDCVPPYDCPHY